MPSNVQVARLRELAMVVIPTIGLCTVHGDKGPFHVKELVECRTAYPTVVIPQGKDGSVGHAVTVVDDLIFDSTQKRALKLQRMSLDWICDGDGCEKILIAYRFEKKWLKRKRLERKMTLHGW